MMHMRRLLLLSFFITLSIYSFSQRFYGGAIVGFNASQVEGDRYRGFNKPGLIGGVWAQTDISEKYYWGLELKYNEKGSRKNQNPKKNDYDEFVYRLNYIDLPVIAGYKYNDAVSFFGGLSFGVLIHKYEEFNGDPSPSISDSNLHNWELGMLIGAKVDFDKILDRRWAKKFIFDMRFQYSALSTYGKLSPFFIYSYTESQFNNLISMALFYRIGS
jgi:hypothetical protein